MKIYLLDINESMTNEWCEVFQGENRINNDKIEVNIVHGDFKSLLDNIEIQCIVSPANAFGLMDGGYDLAITEYFGTELQDKVQEHIIKEYYGEQILCTSFIVDIPNTDKKLIHTPTMMIPMDMSNSDVAYQSTRATLICAINNNIDSIVIPAFAGGCGKMKTKVIAKQMRLAFENIFNRTNEINWDYALNRCENISKTFL